MKSLRSCKAPAAYCNQNSRKMKKIPKTLTKSPPSWKAQKQKKLGKVGGRPFNRLNDRPRAHELVTQPRTPVESSNILRQLANFNLGLVSVFKNMRFKPQLPCQGQELRQ